MLFLGNVVRWSAYLGSTETAWKGRLAKAGALASFVQTQRIVENLKFRLRRNSPDRWGARVVIPVECDQQAHLVFPSSLASLLSDCSRRCPYLLAQNPKFPNESRQVQNLAP